MGSACALPGQSEYTDHVAWTGSSGSGCGRVPKTEKGSGSTCAVSRAQHEGNGGKAPAGQGRPERVKADQAGAAEAAMLLIFSLPMQLGCMVLAPKSGHSPKPSPSKACCPETIIGLMVVQACPDACIQQHPSTQGRVCSARSWKLGLCTSQRTFLSAQTQTAGKPHRRAAVSHICCDHGYLTITGATHVIRPNLGISSMTPATMAATTSASDDGP
ncbi:hypothetical protein HaLaN_00707 [Haematococcus lacustris]|uniref:Uncharacterized protein n=1 Tax=Haematococcus lacustris TaxID=44745 RepID=A0A699YE69_HAELA|nr:hypothetical protein HaLaN_00707 [Haematococcus lacustris]